jgi:hypothetical protein
VVRPAGSPPGGVLAGSTAPSGATSAESSRLQSRPSSSERMRRQRSYWRSAAPPLPSARWAATRVRWADSRRGSPATAIVAASIAWACRPALLSRCDALSRACSRRCWNRSRATTTQSSYQPGRRSCSSSASPSGEGSVSRPETIAVASRWARSRSTATPAASASRSRLATRVPAATLPTRQIVVRRLAEDRERGAAGHRQAAANSRGIAPGWSARRARRRSSPVPSTTGPPWPRSSKLPSRRSRHPPGPVPPSRSLMRLPRPCPPLDRSDGRD